MRLILIAAAALSPALTLLGCSSGSSDDDGTPLIVATTGHIHDALVSLTDGVPVELRLLCGPGVDPHSYGATTRDVQAIQRAALVVYNGYHLEAELGDILERSAVAEKSFAMASVFPDEYRLDWVEDGEVDANAPFDPHIWNHLPGWAACVQGLEDHLAEAFPNDADAIRSNGKSYRAEIDKADGWAKQKLARIPKERRVLVSGHDAFNYFARRYNLETYAVLGVGNDPEADIRTVQAIAELVTERKIPTIFLESITQGRITRSIRENCRSKGWDVEIADTPLYSDDLGDAPPFDTYLGAFRTNVETIVDGLAGGA